MHTIYGIAAQKSTTPTQSIRQNYTSVYFSTDVHGRSFLNDAIRHIK